ncbi:hypothetical protein [Ornithinimicrobium avium]|uniref:Uncharacterized protein n=1 Tax=Ornithinimicrobium avium TaxID=2283195 RepID=A0A345NK77_9MICO|nr:hypothetical protein [Ornithinimicrobium avium]AXH95435.1 hypothetical protein DV701_04195 [Ornithinimicrobium avium]
MGATPAAPLPTPAPAPLLASVSSRMSIVWPVAVLAALVVGYGLDPITEITAMLMEQGVTDAQAAATAFAAGVTLPVVVGTAATVLLVGSGALERMEGLNQVLAVTGIFAVTGLGSMLLGLGLAPDFAGTDTVSGPPYVALPLFVLRSYLSSYGFPLLMVGLALGTATGLQVYRWLGMSDRT